MDISRRVHWLWVAGLSFLLSAQQAAADNRDNFNKPTFDLQLFRPAIDSRGYVTVNSSKLLGHLDFSLGLQGSWAFQPLTLQLDAGSRYGGDSAGPEVSNTRTFAIEHLISPQFQFAIGLWKWVELGIGLPLGIAMGRREQCDSNGENCAGYNQAGISDQLRFTQVMLSDVGLHAKVRILDPMSFPIGIAALISGYLPISKWAGDDGYKTFLGEDNFTLRPQLILEREWGSSRRIRTAINVGAVVRFGGTTFTDVGKSVAIKNDTICYPSDSSTATGNCNPGTTFGGTGLSRSVGTQITYGLSVAFGIVPNRFDFLVEGYGYADVTGNDKALPVEAVGAMKLYLAKNSFFLIGAGAGVYGNGGAQTGSSRARAFLGFVYEPRIGDRDGDGIRDNLDQCPDEPEDLDGFQDTDGCPELDNDNDGVPDSKDKCPNVPGTWDNKGCPTDSDRDGDGIPDSKDKCPDDPEDLDGWQDQDGCPDMDNDGDGIPDHLDKCPNEAETVNGIDDKDGCPDGEDTDKDGIPDAQDKCPFEAEDKDGFEDSDGCPDLDNDKDRIPDKDDKCPNEPEKYNGFEDEDGCPDKGRVMMEGGKINILDKVYFETGKATIKPVSFPILDAVAATLKGNPEIELVEIQGHADERGDDNANLRLTAARTQSVKAYLEKKGVEGNRLVANGYGETKPVCTDSNEECWEKNRRVEFVILKPAAPGAQPPNPPPQPALKAGPKRKKK